MSDATQIRTLLLASFPNRKSFLLKRKKMPQGCRMALGRHTIFGWPLLLLLIWFCAIPTTTQASICAKDHDHHHPDFVERLPGYNAPLPSPWYSGFLDYTLEGRQVHTHYVFIEAEDDDGIAGDDKPLIYWSNGGPGASSLFGILTELGPLLLSDDSLRTEDYRISGIPTPIYNPYSWTRLGHVVMIDQPAPVGFSSCNNETESHSCGGLAWTDELAAENSFRALRAFYEKFSCLQEKNLFLTGESYGGIYIPTLARRILEDDDDDDDNIPLKGFAVGDGCLGTETDLCIDISNPDAVPLWGILFLAGHGQMPLSTYDEFLDTCLVDDDASIRQHFARLGSGGGGIGGTFWNSRPAQSSFAQADLNNALRRSPECQAVVDKIQRQVGNFFVYSLYDDCTYENGIFKSSSGQPVVLDDQSAAGGNHNFQGALNDYPCGGDVVMEHWLGLPAVKQALHVQDATFFSVDNAEGDFDYTPTEPDLTGFYKHVAEETDLRVLVYNGDTDPAITSFAAQNWTSQLGLAELHEWRPWTVDACQRMGGYVTRYEGGFDFLTIRGAGHMVPTYKNAATFAFMQSWIQNKDYPQLDPKCKRPPTTTLSNHREPLSVQ